jgi:hypothetical protein
MREQRGGRRRALEQRLIEKADLLNKVGSRNRRACQSGRGYGNFAALWGLLCRLRILHADNVVGCAGSRNPRRRHNECCGQRYKRGHQQSCQSRLHLAESMAHVDRPGGGNPRDLHCLIAGLECGHDRHGADTDAGRLEEGVANSGSDAHNRRFARACGRQILTID